MRVKLVALTSFDVVDQVSVKFSLRMASLRNMRVLLCVCPAPPFWPSFWALEYIKWTLLALAPAADVIKLGVVGYHVAHGCHLCGLGDYWCSSTYLISANTLNKTGCQNISSSIFLYLYLLTANENKVKPINAVTHINGKWQYVTVGCSIICVLAHSCLRDKEYY